MCSFKNQKPIKVWSFVVLAAASLSHLIGEGFSYGIIGFFTMAQAEHFNINIAESGWTASIHLATSIIAAPLAGSLTRLLSLRAIQMIGGVTAMIGVGCSSFSSTPAETRLLFGFVAGFGLSLTRTASTAIVSRHFGDEWINFALASLTVGSSCGLVAFPMISYNLFLDFDYAGVLLALAVVMMIHVICALTYTNGEPLQVENVFQAREQYVVQEDEPTCTCGRFGRAILNVITHLPNWAYLLAACYQTYGIASFFSLMSNYAVKNTGLSMEEVAQGSLSLGSTAVVGIVAISVTYHMDYNRLVPLTVTPFVCGLAAIAITKIENVISYTMLMGLYGLSYGMLITSHMGVYHSKTLGQDERMVFSALQLLLESIGSLTGPPLTGLIDVLYSPNVGVYYSASCSIKAGLCFLPILVYDYIIKPCLEDRKEKNEIKETIIHMNGHDIKQVKYQRLLQQYPESTNYKTDLQVY